MQLDAPSGDAADFYARLEASVPELGPVIRQSIADHGELLSHLAMSAIVGSLIDAVEAHKTDRDFVATTMNFMSSAFASEPPEIVELIAASFVENLPYPGEAGRELLSMLPPNLRSELIAQRGEV